MPKQISIEAARNIMLAAQGLAHPVDRPATKSDVLASIRRMHLLQIDTINVVARSPYLVLWSRLGDFEPRWLEELLAEQSIFESWSHAYCFQPIDEYPLHYRRMIDSVNSTSWPYKWAVEWSREHTELLDRIRSHIQTNGAVKSADFENKDHRTGGWWNWKEEKDALESMLLLGELMIARRQNFQRVYDLRERILPDFNDSQLPNTEEVSRALILRSVQALGISLPGWVADYFRLPKNGIAEKLEVLARESQLQTIEVEGLAGLAYIHPDNLTYLESVMIGELKPTLTTLLSPFDPLIWDRNRASQLFGFNYQIECYTPAAKRKYGYFNMPILHKGNLIGRLDPKAHRSKGVLEIKSIHFEPGVEITRELGAELMQTLRQFGKWQGLSEIVINRIEPGEFVSVLG
jgi:uncharacterized protein YcaQ